MIEFSLARVPVRIRPSFWIVAGLLGLGLGDPRLLALWVAVVFVSVLVHEMGHALTARRFGADAAVELNTIGGLTSWRSDERGLTPGRRAAVAAAGSAAGIALGLATLGSFHLVGPTGGLVGLAVTMIVWVNIGWGVLNWLPIRMLDGGHLVMSLLDLVAGDRAKRIADGIFLLTALVAVAAAVYFRLPIVTVMAVFVLVLEIARHVRRRSRDGAGDAAARPTPAAETPEE